MQARERALTAVIECYWRPLYKLARVIRHQTREQAEDATQSFFVRALEKDALSSYDPRRGGFRPYLRTLFENHLANEWKASQRLKRGGLEEHLDFDSVEEELSRDRAHTTTPEEYFQREWARSVFQIAVERLRKTCVGDGQLVRFRIFDAYDIEGDRSLTYRELSERYGIPETQVTNHLAAARRLFREIVLEQLRELTASEAEFRTEARALLGVTL